MTEMPPDRGAATGPRGQPHAPIAYDGAGYPVPGGKASFAQWPLASARERRLARTINWGAAAICVLWFGGIGMTFVIRDRTFEALTWTTLLLAAMGAVWAFFRLNARLGEAIQRSHGAAMAGELRVCPACQYDLAGLGEVGVCPECGKRYDPETLRTRWVLIYEAWERTRKAGSE